MDDNYKGQNIKNKAPSAYVIDASEGGPDQGEFVDSGSANHWTNDLTNLNLRAEKVTVGNGQKLKIFHVGHTTMPICEQNHIEHHFLHLIILSMLYVF